MPAAATDKFMKVGEPGTATTLSAPGYSIGATSITIASTTNFPSDTGFIFAIDQAEIVNGEQVRVAGTYCTFTGVVTGATTIGSVALLDGTPQDYPAGALTRVYITVASEHTNRLMDGILVHADQDGTLKAGAVDNAAVLASDVVTTAKILNDNVTYAKLLSTIFSGQLTTYTNPGSAGGTNSFFYGNIGGIKLFFGTTAAVSTSAGATTCVITYPVGFFTTVRYVSSQTFAMTGVATQYSSISDSSLGTTNVTPYIVSTGGGTSKLAFLAIGN